MDSKWCHIIRNQSCQALFVGTSRIDVTTVGNYANPIVVVTAITIFCITHHIVHVTFVVYSEWTGPINDLSGFEMARAKPARLVVGTSAPRWWIRIHRFVIPSSTVGSILLVSDDDIIPTQWCRGSSFSTASTAIIAAITTSTAATTATTTTTTTATATVVVRSNRTCHRIDGGITHCDGGDGTYQHRHDAIGWTCYRHFGTSFGHGKA